MSSPMAYRRDLDGMRAVAVLLVILYHYGIAPISGGYLGVDVFFVLSGYFITKLILRGHAKGTFSLYGFYQRRARRLLPSAMLVLIATSAIMLVIAPPAELAEFANSVVASLLFFANFHFKDTFTYFGPAAETQPLLHFWSLSVEEQFYFLAPAVILFLLRWKRAVAASGLILIGLASLALSSWQVYAQPADAFFHLPSRGWELMAGSVLAFANLPATSVQRHLRELILFLALATLGLLAVTLTHSSPFPGLNALPAILATMAIIVFGNTKARGSLVQPATWLLGNPVMNWIGRLSYSLYIWHWPVLVLYRLRVGEPDSWIEKAALFGVTVIVSALGYYLVEQPIRQQRILTDWRRFAPALAGVASLIIGFGVLASLTGGYKSRAPASIIALEAALENDPDEVCQTHMTDAQDIKLCTVGRLNSAPFEASAVTTLLIGDSHARALQPYFDHEMRRAEQSMVILYKGDCLPVIGPDFHKGHRLKCPQMKQIVAQIPDRFPALEHIYITARWARITQPKRNSQAERIGLSLHGGPVIDEAAQRSAMLSQALAETVAMFRARGIEVTLISQVPAYVEPPKRCIIRALWASQAPEHCGILPDEAAEWIHPSETLLSSLAARNETVDVLLPGQALCAGARCDVYAQGVSLYRDDNHLSVAGSLYLAEQMPLPLRSKPDDAP